MFLLSVKTANGWTEMVKSSKKNTSSVWDGRPLAKVIQADGSAKTPISIFTLKLLWLFWIFFSSGGLWKATFSVNWKCVGHVRKGQNSITLYTRNAYKCAAWVWWDDTSSIAGEVLPLKLNLRQFKMNCSVETKPNRKSTHRLPTWTSSSSSWKKLRPPSIQPSAVASETFFFFFLSPGRSELMTNLLHALRQQPALRANPPLLKFLAGCDADWKWVVSQEAGGACWDGRVIQHW